MNWELIDGCNAFYQWLVVVGFHIPGYDSRGSTRPYINPGSRAEDIPFGVGRWLPRLPRPIKPTRTMSLAPWTSPSAGEPNALIPRVIPAATWEDFLRNSRRVVLLDEASLKSIDNPYFIVVCSRPYVDSGKMAWSGSCPRVEIPSLPTECQ